MICELAMTKFGANSLCLQNIVLFRLFVNFHVMKVNDWLLKSPLAFHKNLSVFVSFLSYFLNLFFPSFFPSPTGLSSLALLFSSLNSNKYCTGKHSVSLLYTDLVIFAHFVSILFHISVFPFIIHPCWPCVTFSFPRTCELVLFLKSCPCAGPVRGQCCSRCCTSSSPFHKSDDVLNMV